jgi:hypothetical protein
LEQSIPKSGPVDARLLSHCKGRKRKAAPAW